MNPTRACLLALISLYRIGISPVLPGSCRFQPTCSAYALDAVRRFGPGRGGVLAVRRLARCHPWGGWGYDPVPDSLCRSGCVEHRTAVDPCAHPRSGEHTTA